MLMTCLPNFKAKRLLQERYVFTIYQHVLFGETIMEIISLLLLAYNFGTQIMNSKIML